MAKNEENKSYLKEVKSNPIFISLKNAIKLADESVERVKTIKQNYMDTVAIKINSEVDTLLNDTLYDIFKLSFIKELQL